MVTNLFTKSFKFKNNPDFNYVTIKCEYNQNENKLRVIIISEKYNQKVTDKINELVNPDAIEILHVQYAKICWD